MDDTSQPISQQLVAVVERVAEGARNLRRMRKAELMGHAAGLGVNTRRRGPDGKKNVHRSMEEVMRATAQSGHCHWRTRRGLLPRR